MTYRKNRKISSQFFRGVAYFILITFLQSSLFPVGIPKAYAQTFLNLPAPGAMIQPSLGFVPTMLRGIKFYPDQPLKFDFIVDKGDAALWDQAFKAEAEKLIKYFLASLTIPEKDFWVNLSPYEKDRIVPAAMGQTDMGMDMLAQDYILKQITASFIHPDNELGKKFWEKIYKAAYEKFGTTNIPVDTFNKVWIVPQKAVVYASGDKVFVTEAKLKVMLEEDYLAIQNLKLKAQSENNNNAGDASDRTRVFASDIVREVIIPELEKEVNEGKNFAELRQIYQAVILAAWFKENLKNSILNKFYTDKSKVKGIDLARNGAAAALPDQIYQRYLEAYKKGVCNFIKVEYDQNEKRNIPRKYFTGGTNLAVVSSGILQETSDPRVPAIGDCLLVTVNSTFIGPAQAPTPLADLGSSPLSRSSSSIDAQWTSEALKKPLASLLVRSETRDFTLDQSIWPEAKAVVSLINKPLSNKNDILARQKAIDILVKINKGDEEKIKALYDGTKNWIASYQRLLRLEDGPGHQKIMPFEKMVKKGKVTKEGLAAILAENNPSGEVDDDERTPLSPEEAYFLLYTIEREKDEINKLIEMTEALDSDVLKSLAKELKEALALTKALDAEALIDVAGKESPSEFSQLLVQIENILTPALINIGAFMRFAQMAKESGFARATCDETQAESFEAGWLLFDKKSKKEQVKNNSAADVLQVILTGSNMSGKSYYLKTNLLMHMCFQAFGYVPAQKANMRVYDTIAYLDRPSTASHQNLSAFGKEIKNLVLLEQAPGAKKILFIDEGGSTTSPQEQAKLLKAIDGFARENTIKHMIATHNEEYINAVKDLPDTATHHLWVDIIDNKPVYKYELRDGADDSNAIVVARGQGLPEDFLKVAQEVVDGNPPPITVKIKSALMAKEKKIPVIERFFPQAVYLKTVSKDGKKEIIDVNPNTNFTPVFLKLSQDRDLSDQYAPANKDFDFIARNRNRTYELMRNFIMESNARSREDFLARQKMFTEILKYGIVDQVLKEKDHLSDLFFFLVSNAHFNRSAINITWFKMLAQDVAREGFIEMISTDDIVTAAKFLVLIAEANERLLKTTIKEMGIDQEVNIAKEVIDIFSRLNDLHQESIDNSKEAFEAHLARIKAMDERMRKLSGSKNDYPEKDVAKFLAKTIQSAASKAEKTLKPISLYERSNWQPVREEVARMFPEAEAHVKRHHYFLNDDFPPEIYNLDTILDSEDHLSALTNLLKKTDSAYLHELADHLEGLVATFLGDIRRGTDYFERTIKKSDELVQKEKDIKALEALEQELAAPKVSLAEMFEKREVREMIKAVSASLGEDDWYWGSIQSAISHLGLLKKLVDKEINLGGTFKTELLGKEVAMSVDEAAKNGLAECFKQYIYHLKDVMRYEREVLAGHRSNIGYSHRIKEGVDSELFKLQVIMSLAKLMQNQNWQDATLTDGPDIIIDNGYNLAKEKAPQVPLSIALRQGQGAFFTNTNMSGKTFGEKTIIWNVLCALATGRAPGKVSLPLLNHVIYLDRVTRQHDQTLSAFGHEGEYWKALLKAAQDPTSLIILDEPASTTSPKYQKGFDYSLSDAILSNGHFMVMATHNGEFLEMMEKINPALTKLWHYKTHLDEKGEVVFDYLLESGLGEHQGRLVAKTLGLDKILKHWPEDDMNSPPASSSAISSDKAREFLVSEGLNVGKYIDKDFKDIVDAYGYDGFKKLFDAARGDQSWGFEASTVFRFALPTLKKIFTPDELRDYWPDIVRIGVAAGKNVRNVLGYGFPAVRKLITDKASLNAIGDDLVALCTQIKGHRLNYGFQVGHFFKDGLFKLSKTLTDEQFKASWSNIVMVVGAAEGESKDFFENTLPAIKKLFTPSEFNRYLPIIFRLAAALGKDVALLDDGLITIREIITDEKSFDEAGDQLVRLITSMPKKNGNVAVFLLGKGVDVVVTSGVFVAVKTFFTTEEFKAYWPTLVQIAIDAGEGAPEALKIGLPVVRSLITDKASLSSVGNDLARIAAKTKGQFVSFIQDNFSKITTIFTPAELAFYWPGLASLCESSEKNASNFIDILAALKKNFSSKEMKTYWPDLVRHGLSTGKNAWLFFNVLQGMRFLVTDLSSLNSVGSDIARLIIAADENAQDLFEYGLPLVRHLITDQKSLNDVGNELVRLGIAAGKNAKFLFKYGLPALQPLIADQGSLNSVGNDLVRLGAASGENALILFSKGLPVAKGLFPSDKFKVYWPGLVRLGIAAGKEAGQLFQSGLPTIEKKFGKNYLSQHWTQINDSLLKICQKTNPHSRERVLFLLLSEYPDPIKNNGPDFLSFLDFVSDVVAREPRLCLQILEGMRGAIDNNLIGKKDFEEGQDTILSFISLTHSFSPSLYKLYKDSGEPGLKKVLVFAESILSDNIDEREVAALENYFRENGISEKNINEAVVAAMQIAIPSSGASFVKKQEIIGLYTKFRNAGDKRKDIPAQLRDKDFSDGTVIDLMDYALKQGETFDPAGNIHNIISSLRQRHEELSSDEIKDAEEKDKEALVVALKEWFRDFSSQEKKEKALSAFYAFASHSDLLKEKIDAITDDYMAIVLLESLFVDKDNLSVLLRDILQKDMSILDLPRTKNLSGSQKVRPITNAEGLKKQLGKAWATWGEKGLSSDDKKIILQEMLRGYSRQELADKVLSLMDGGDVLLKETILGLPEGGITVSKERIIEALFSKPYTFIQQEKQKFITTKKGKVDLEFRVVKGIPYGLWGLLAGVCIATDLALWSKKEFFLVAIIDKATKKAVGFVHLFESEKDSHKILTVPGIEPSVEFLTEVKAEDAFEKIEKALIKMADEGGYSGLYLPTNENILSNRPSISRIIKEKYSARISNLPKKVSWNTVPQDYSFQEVYSMWERTSLSASVSSSALNVDKAVRAFFTDVEPYRSADKDEGISAGTTFSYQMMSSFPGQYDQWAQALKAIYIKDPNLAGVLFTSVGFSDTERKYWFDGSVHGEWKAMVREFVKYPQGWDMVLDMLNRGIAHYRSNALVQYDGSEIPIRYNIGVLGGLPAYFETSDECKGFVQKMIEGIDQENLPTFIDAMILFAKYSNEHWSKRAEDLLVEYFREPGHRDIVPSLDAECQEWIEEENIIPPRSDEMRRKKVVQGLFRYIEDSRSDDRLRLGQRFMELSMSFLPENPKQWVEVLREIYRKNPDAAGALFVSAGTGFGNDWAEWFDSAHQEQWAAMAQALTETSGGWDMLIDILNRGLDCYQNGERFKHDQREFRIRRNFGVLGGMPSYWQVSREGIMFDLVNAVNEKNRPVLLNAMILFSNYQQDTSHGKITDSFLREYFSKEENRKIIPSLYGDCQTLLDMRKTIVVEAIDPSEDDAAKRYAVISWVFSVFEESDMTHDPSDHFALGETFRASVMSYLPDRPVQWAKTLKEIYEKSPDVAGVLLTSAGGYAPGGSILDSPEGNAHGFWSATIRELAQDPDNWEMLIDMFNRGFDQYRRNATVTYDGKEVIVDYGLGTLGCLPVYLENSSKWITDKIIENIDKDNLASFFDAVTIFIRYTNPQHREQSENILKKYFSEMKDAQSVIERLDPECRKWLEWQKLIPTVFGAKETARPAFWDDAWGIPTDEEKIVAEKIMKEMLVENYYDPSNFGKRFYDMCENKIGDKDIDRQLRDLGKTLSALRAMYWLYPDITPFVFTSFMPGGHGVWKKLFESADPQMLDMLIFMINHLLNDYQKREGETVYVKAGNSEYSISFELKLLGGLFAYLDEKLALFVAEGIHENLRKTLADVIVDYYHGAAQYKPQAKVILNSSLFREYIKWQDADMPVLVNDEKIVPVQKNEIQQKRSQARPESIHPGEGLGKLVIVPDNATIQDLKNIPKDSIVVMKTLWTSDMDVGPFRGMIITGEQTKGDHSVSRCEAWQSPLIFYPKADKEFQYLAGKNVYYLVSRKGIIIRSATFDDITRMKPRMEAKEKAREGRVIEVPRALLGGEGKGDGLIFGQDPRLQDPHRVGYKVALLNMLSAMKFETGNKKVLAHIAGGQALPFSVFAGFLREKYLMIEYEQKVYQLTLALVNSKYSFERECTAFQAWLKENLRESVRALLKEDADFLNILEDFINNGGFVRGSMTAENPPAAPFLGSGIYKTVQNVKGTDNVAEAILDVYASLWSPEAVRERFAYRIDQDKAWPAIWFNESEKTDYSFVLHTTDKVDTARFTAEIVPGYGQAIVSNEIPGKSTEIEFDKITGKVLSAVKATMRQKIVLDDKQGGTKVVKAKRGEEFLRLKDKDILEEALFRVGTQAEKFFKRPVEIEGTISYDKHTKAWEIALRQVRHIYNPAVVTSSAVTGSQASSAINPQLFPATMPTENEPDWIPYGSQLSDVVLEFGKELAKEELFKKRKISISIIMSPKQKTPVRVAGEKLFINPNFLDEPFDEFNWGEKDAVRKQIKVFLNGYAFYCFLYPEETEAQIRQRTIEYLKKEKLLEEHIIFLETNKSGIVADPAWLAELEACLPKIDMPLDDAFLSKMTDEELYQVLPLLLKERFHSTYAEAKTLADGLYHADYPLFDKPAYTPKNYRELEHYNRPIGIRLLRLNPNILKMVSTIGELQSFVSNKSNYYKKLMYAMVAEGWHGLPRTIQLSFVDPNMRITRQEFTAFHDIFTMANLYVFMRKGLEEIIVTPDKEYRSGEYISAKMQAKANKKTQISLALYNVYYDSGFPAPTTPVDVAEALLMQSSELPDFAFLNENILPEFISTQGLVRAFPGLIIKMYKFLANDENSDYRKLAAISWFSSEEDLKSLLKDDYTKTASFAKETLGIPSEVKAQVKRIAFELSQYYFDGVEDFERLNYQAGFLTALYININLLVAALYYEKGKPASHEFISYLRKSIEPGLIKAAQTKDSETFGEAVVAQLLKCKTFLQEEPEWNGWHSSATFGDKSFSDFKGSPLVVANHLIGVVSDRIVDTTQDFHYYHAYFTKWEKEYHDYKKAEMIREARMWWKYHQDEDMGIDPEEWIKFGKDFEERFREEYGDDLFNEVWGADFAETFKKQTMDDDEKNYGNGWKAWGFGEGDEGERAPSVEKGKMPPKQAMEVLGFTDEKEITKESIKTAYRKACLEYHPDRHMQEIEKDPGLKKKLEEKMVNAQEARDSLEKWLKEQNKNSSEEKISSAVVTSSAVSNEVLSGKGQKFRFSENGAEGKKSVIVDSDKEEVGTTVKFVFPLSASSSSLNEAPGGIDFGADKLNLKTKGRGIDFALPTELKGIDLNSIEGLVPVIINIVPIVNFQGYVKGESLDAPIAATQTAQDLSEAKEPEVAEAALL